jgi:hypothetical protein
MNRTDESNPGDDFLGSLLGFLLLIAVIAVLVASCSGGQPSSYGLGGDPNPEQQYADPCSTFERRCDEGTNPGDMVPDRNGELLDQH